MTRRRPRFAPAVTIASRRAHACVYHIVYTIVEACGSEEKMARFFRFRLVACSVAGPSEMESRKCRTKTRVNKTRPFSSGIFLRKSGTRRREEEAKRAY